MDIHNPLDFSNDAFITPYSESIPCMIPNWYLPTEIIQTAIVELVDIEAIQHIRHWL